VDESDAPCPDEGEVAVRVPTLHEEDAIYLKARHA